MKALSWKQPFASLMLKGKIETRKWYTGYRGLVLICSSQKPYTLSQQYEIMGVAQQTRATEILSNDSLFNGYAIAIGELVDCQKMRPNIENDTFVKFDSSLYLHIYSNIKEIIPFPFKGSQGWKNITPQDIDKIVFLDKTLSLDSNAEKIIKTVTYLAPNYDGSLHYVTFTGSEKDINEYL